MLAGCGGDDDDSSSAELSTEEFCAHLEELDDESSETPDVSVIDDVIAVAPNELRESLGVLRDAFVELEEVDDGEDGFEAAMEIMFQPAVFAASMAVEEWGVENCGFDPDDGVMDIELEDESDIGDDDSGVEDEVSSDTDMPDDVTLGRRDALVITWTETAEAFQYRIEIDGATVGTTFGDRYLAVGFDAADVVVEAMEMGDVSLGPVADLSVSPGEALVLDWTEDPSGFYYVEYSTTSEGTTTQMVNAPFTVPVAVDEVIGLRFGPGIVLSGSEGEAVDSPFAHGEQFWVELEIP